MGFVVVSFTFLSDERYSHEWYELRQMWEGLLAGNGDAPAQYRIGVIYFANFLSGLTHGHLAFRHVLALMDGVFLALAMTVLFYLVSRSQIYRRATAAARVALTSFGLMLLLYYMFWLFFYHKPETVANFACLTVAAALIAGKPRIPVTLAFCCLVLISAYLGTVRADSGFALNLGILIVAIIPGERILPLGRWVQAAAGLAGIFAVLGVEYYIKQIMFPNNPYPISKFQLLHNLTTVSTLVCVPVALGPWFLTVWFAGRNWARLESWEQALVAASLVEFPVFFVVAMANEVRLFLPYAMVLIPTASALMLKDWIGEKSAA